MTSTRPKMKSQGGARRTDDKFRFMILFIMMAEELHRFLLSLILLVY